MGTPVATTVRDMLPVLDALVRRDSLSVAEVEQELCLLGYRVAVARQREALDAAVRLAESTLGHMAVGFVRTACEEFLWLKYLASLDVADANEVFVALGNFDNMRSVQAALGFAGVDALVGQGFPRGFVDASGEVLVDAEDRLRGLKNRLGWDNRRGPSAGWVATAVGERPLFDYLYAASSRSVHFSAGEMLRRGWFDQDGRVSVADVDHRLFLSDFALSELVRLLMKTLCVADRWLGVGQVDVEADLATMHTAGQSFDERVAAFGAVGRVPLVWAREFEQAWASVRQRRPA
jgi:hypothetical protein